MNSKKTDDLRTALKNASGIESFLNDNAEAFTNPNIGDLISLNSQVFLSLHDFYGYT